MEILYTYDPGAAPIEPVKTSRDLSDLIMYAENQGFIPLAFRQDDGVSGRLDLVAAEKDWQIGRILSEETKSGIVYSLFISDYYPRQFNPGLTKFQAMARPNSFSAYFNEYRCDKNGKPVKGYWKTKFDETQVGDRVVFNESCHFELIFEGTQNNPIHPQIIRVFNVAYKSDNLLDVIQKSKECGFTPGEMKQTYFDGHNGHLELFLMTGHEQKFTEMVKSNSLFPDLYGKVVALNTIDDYCTCIKPLIERNEGFREGQEMYFSVPLHSYSNIHLAWIRELLVELPDTCPQPNAHQLFDSNGTPLLTNDKESTPTKGGLNLFEQIKSMLTRTRNSEFRLPDKNVTRIFVLYLPTNVLLHFPNRYDLCDDRTKAVIDKLNHDSVSRQGLLTDNS